jgi:hypothetical protein
MAKLNWSAARINGWNTRALSDERDFLGRDIAAKWLACAEQGSPEPHKDGKNQGTTKNTRSEWAPVAPEFWRIWHASKHALKKKGYSVRKNENGEWEVRYNPPKSSSPLGKGSAVFIPTEMKASICFGCGHVEVINVDDKHRDCALCGEEVERVDAFSGNANYSRRKSSG